MSWPFTRSGLGSLGTTANPRAHNLQYNLMNEWQHFAHAERRDRLPRLPEKLRKSLLKRLRRWTWYRDINGEEHFLLYRGLNPKDIGSVTLVPGQRLQFPYRTSFTVDANTAERFATQYGGKYVEMWVPASAIATSPYMYGPELRGYDHGEREIIVDAGTMILHSMGDRPTFHPERFKYMMDSESSWGKAQADKLRWNDEREESGKSMTRSANPNPLMFRVEQPTPDAKTTAFEYRWNR